VLLSGLVSLTQWVSSWPASKPTKRLIRDGRKLVAGA